MGERVVEVFRSAGEDGGEPKVVRNEVTGGVTRPEGSGPKALVSKISDGGIVRVA